MKNLFKPAFILVLFLFTTTTTTNIVAQEVTVKKKNDLNTFNLYFINGYALSYNFYNTESYYLRAHLDIFLSSNESDSEGESSYQYIFNGEKRTFTGDAKNDYFNITVSPQIIFPVYTTSFGQVYLGGGPFLGYGKSTNSFNQETVEYYPDTTSTPSISTNSNFSKTKNINAGLVLAVGIKAFITDNISLFAETQFQGGRRWQENETTQEWTSYSGTFSKGRNTSDSDGWFYDAQFIRMGVSISL